MLFQYREPYRRSDLDLVRIDAVRLSHLRVLAGAAKELLARVAPVVPDARLYCPIVSLVFSSAVTSSLNPLIEGDLLVDESADDLEVLLVLLQFDQLATLLKDHQLRSWNTFGQFFGERQRCAEVVGPAYDQGWLRDLAEPGGRVMGSDHVNALEADLSIAGLLGMCRPPIDPCLYLFWMLACVTGREQKQGVPREELGTAPLFGHPPSNLELTMRIRIEASEGRGQCEGVDGVRMVKRHMLRDSSARRSSKDVHGAQIEVLHQGRHVLGQLLRRRPVRCMRALARAPMVRQDDVVMLSKILDLRTPARSGTAKATDHQYGRFRRIAQLLVILRESI